MAPIRCEGLIPEGKWLPLVGWGKVVTERIRRKLQEVGWFTGLVRQGKGESGSYTRFALHPDVAAMSVDDALSDIKPQASAFCPGELSHIGSVMRLLSQIPW